MKRKKGNFLIWCHKLCAVERFSSAHIIQLIVSKEYKKSHLISILDRDKKRVNSLLFPSLLQPKIWNVLRPNFTKLLATQLSDTLLCYVIGFRRLTKHLKVFWGRIFSQIENELVPSWERGIWEKHWELVPSWERAWSQLVPSLTKNRASGLDSVYEECFGPCLISYYF